MKRLRPEILKQLVPHIRHGQHVLHAGCGGSRIPGATHIDLHPNDDDVLKMDIRDLSFVTDLYDFVFASHVVEHLTVQDGLKALKEFYRVLRPGGRCWVSVPDFEAFIEFYQQAQDLPQPEVMMYAINTWVFGSEADGMGHKAVFDMNLLEAMFNTAGFSVELATRNDSQNYTPSMSVMGVK